MTNPSPDTTRADALAQLRDTQAQRAAITAATGVFTPAGRDHALADTYDAEARLWGQLVNRAIAGEKDYDALQMEAFMSAEYYARDRAYEERRWARSLAGAGVPA
jgi:hypothetical protein